MSVFKKKKLVIFDFQGTLCDGIFRPKLKLYAKSLLESLHTDKFVGIASNASQSYLEKHLMNLKVLPYIHKIESASNNPSKPNPQMILNIMDFFNCTREETIFIGDTITDIETANNARIDAILFVQEKYLKHKQLKDLNKISSLKELL